VTQTTEKGKRAERKREKTRRNKTKQNNKFNLFELHAILYYLFFIHISNMFSACELSFFAYVFDIIE
jgi:hypothetical protein